MLKQMGLILMLVSSMAMSANECTIDDIMKCQSLGNFFGIGDKEAMALADVLKENKNIKMTDLDLGGNEIGDIGAKELAIALLKNETLTKLNLYDNRIRDRGAEALSWVLRVNNSLTELDLSWNSIGAEGGEALAEALKDNDTLTYLDLRLNAIGDEYKKVLKNLPRVKSGQLTLDI